MTRILEAFTRGKRRDGSGNEDGIVCAAHCLAVVDGATAKDGALYGGKLSGQFAKDVLCAALQETALAETPFELVRRLTAALAQSVLVVTGSDVASREPAFRPSASVVAFLPARRELVFIGDCQALANGQAISFPHVFDPVVAQIRANYFELLLKSGVPVSDFPNYQAQARQLIAPALKWGASLRNIAGNALSHSALDGTEVPLDLVHVVELGEGPHRIVLATDGYPKLLSTLAESERRLAELLKEDPLCIGALLGTKGVALDADSFDDRAYLSIAEL